MLIFRYTTISDPYSKEYFDLMFKPQGEQELIIGFYWVWLLVLLFATEWCTVYSKSLDTQKIWFTNFNKLVSSIPTTLIK
ncbi:hypothetical protein M8C21_033674 [Ambrosia artemisiifolia]|uniref:Uncharacterized protein n=1 Tax=Ambrosia artemisiifolia TaxID=4212 RepID=A0AAD5C7G3_AMBAR|nr:hypothetical protein M8C21_033674 [Ambrosia artemisiifolia]